MDFFKKYGALGAFIFIGLVNIIFYYQKDGSIKVVSSVLIVPSLIAYYRSVVKKPLLIFQLALLFSWIGDLLLLFIEQEVFIKLTIIGFFFTQVLLLLEVRKFITQFNYRFLLMGVLLFASYLITFLNCVFSYLGDLKIYAVVYGLAICSLGCISFMNFFQKQTKLNFALFLGVLLYSFRDVLLTFNVKVYEDQVFTFPIPLFYVISLFLITLFFVYEKSFAK